MLAMEQIIIDNLEVHKKDFVSKQKMNSAIIIIINITVVRYQGRFAIDSVDTKTIIIVIASTLVATTTTNMAIHSDFAAESYCHYCYCFNGNYDFANCCFN